MFRVTNQMPLQQNYDLVLLWQIVLLTLLGTVMIFSTTAALGEIRYQDGLFFLKKRLIHVAFGAVILWVSAQIPYVKWQKHRFLLMAGILIFLALTLIPGIGSEVKGARRWVRFAGLGFQPSEILKVVIVIYISAYLTRKQEQVTVFIRGVLPNLIVIGGFLSLVAMQPDLGTAALIAITALLMIFVGGAKVSHMVMSLFTCAIAAGAMIFTESYRMRRVLAFLDPWQDPLGAGFQVIQSFIAFGSGGWLGQGFTESRQKMLFLPDAHTDFIFAIFAEEWGWVGVSIVLALIVSFIFRTFWIAVNVQEPFGRFLALGIALSLGLQSLFNLSVVTGLIPTKGIPLPFLSYGGSSLVVSYLMVGILLNISKSCPVKTR